MRKEIAEIIAEQDPDLEARTYSGRGMFGEETHGIVYDNLGDVLDAIISASINYHDLMVDASLSNIRTDNMGLSMIMY